MKLYSLGRLHSGSNILGHFWHVLHCVNIMFNLLVMVQNRLGLCVEFAETSAKDTTGGIKELFERIGDRLPALPAQQEAKQGVVAVDKRPQSNAQGAAAGKQSGQCNC